MGAALLVKDHRLPLAQWPEQPHKNSVPPLTPGRKSFMYSCYKPFSFKIIQASWLYACWPEINIRHLSENRKLKLTTNSLKVAGKLVRVFYQ